MSDDARVTTADVAGGTEADADRALARDDAGAGDERLEALLPAERNDSYRTRWHELQATFVDAPRDAVARADDLVTELMQELASTFDDARARLDEQWRRGDDVSTEDLRVALQRYRSFFERLLAA